MLLFFQRCNILVNPEIHGRTFDCSTDNVSLHLKNIYEEEELDRDLTTEIFSVVRKEGNRKVNRELEFYSLDVIIAVATV